MPGGGVDMDRILATHTGSLIRPPDLLAYLAARERGQEIDEEAYQRCLRESVADVVRRQVQAGGDGPGDGGMGKGSWVPSLFAPGTGVGGRSDPPRGRDIVS